MTATHAKPTHRPAAALFAAAIVLAAGAAAQAAPILLAGKLAGDDLTGFVPAEGSDALKYHVLYSTIRTDIADGVARTKIVETIEREDQADANVVCLIPLARAAAAAGAVVRVRPAGDESEPTVAEARFLPEAKARKLCEAVAKATGSVRVLAVSHRPMLVVGELRASGRTEVTVEFSHAVEDVQGVAMFDCPMPAASWIGRPVRMLSLTARIRHAKPLRAAFSPTHAVSVERPSPREAVLTVKAADYGGDDDFGACYVADEGDLGLRVIAHRPAGEKEGYFLLLGNPSTGAAGGKAFDKDVLFVLDTSGSMRGEKIEQARSAIQYCLAKLSPRDRFNIVTFGTEVTGFRDGPTANTKANLAAASEFVDDVVARGRTNISGALEEALAGEAVRGRLRIMIFLTDGTPTAGEIVPDKIAGQVPQWNTSAARVFVMGVGNDVNAHLLDKIAELTNGSSEYVTSDEEIDVKVAALYDRLSNPVLSNVSVAFGDLRPHSVFPRKFTPLFKGSELMVTGRYRAGGTHTVTVAGTLAGEPVRYTCRAEFPEAATAGRAEFVAPLWAARKIGWLLQEIRLNGQKQELVDEIVRLSTKFGIVTEYTEFIASGGGAVGHAEAVEEAKRRMHHANVQQAGQWAVNQARNERELQGRLVATAAGNRYFDRRGRQVALDTIGQIGARTFYLRDGQWVEAEEPGDRKQRVVKLFSKEYFELLRKDRDFARAQRLGWPVSMNVGDERVVVAKDGKTQDEKLKGKTPPPQQVGPNDQQMRLNVQGAQQIQVDPRRNVRQQRAPDKNAKDGKKENDR